MNYTVIFFLVALIYILMAIHTLSKDRNDIRNKLYFAVSMLFASWGLLNASLFLITDPVIAADTRRYLVFSWGVVYSVILHLVIVLSGYDKKLDKYFLAMFLYVPALVNVFLYYFTPIAPEDLVLTEKGWLISNFFEGSWLWDNYFYFYYVTFTLLTIYFVFKWYRKTTQKREQIQSLIMLVTILVAFVLGSILEIILPLQGVLIISGITIIIALIPIIGMYYAIEKYGLMNFNPNHLASDVLHMMSEGLIICNNDGIISTLNQGVTIIIGLEQADIGVNIYEVFREKQDLALFNKPHELDMIHKNGQFIQVMISALPLRDTVEEQYGYLVVFQDISKLSNMQKRLISMNEVLEDTVLERTNELLSLNEDLVNEVKEKQIAEKKIRHLAYYDQLTNLPNLRCFLDNMENRLAYKDSLLNNFAVLFIDLDGFKTINDTKGHTKGDELLKVVARRLENNMIKGDIVARTGGDEFFYIIKLNRQNIYIQTVMDSILKLFEKPFTIEDTKMYITCSIGAAIYPEHGTTTDELVKHSDIAMYEAKNRGKNCSEIFNSKMLKKIVDEEQIKDDLRLAIANNEFELYYQPLVDSRDDKIIGTEALIRWNHPELGVISPIKFIEIAEQNGFIESIGSWVIEEGMKQHKKWLDEFEVHIPISLNLSVNQLLKKDIVIDILKLKKRLGVELKYFEFEVTETVFIDQDSYALKTLKRLSDTGARIAIDDFGIAYSSLAYIKRLPINKIKIDKVFVDGIGKDKRDEVIIKTIVSMCNDLYMDVIAEGVERIEQVEFLKDSNCHKIQGYYYSRPLMVDDFIMLYKKMNRE